MKRFAVGIDLGTTHTVVAYAEPGAGEIRLFEVEQLVAPGEVQALPLLPSLRFHPAAGELPASELRLPWSAPSASEPPVVIGTLARRLGAQVPGRLVASAKSWLSHAAVDRLAPILPWGADEEVRKVSPVEASASYLAHVRAAWNHRFPRFPLEEQDIVLTVPASFDESARVLTVQAARDAGLPHLRLLEEPQAAFYDWLFRHRDRLAAELGEAKLVLVCDVGGGTTDFSLIRVEPGEGDPRLTRIGVGKHLMLGGDNMDLVLAHLAESAMTGGQTAQRLSPARLSQLIERCRAAKEALLGAQAPDKATVTLLGGGSSLVGGARSVDLSREQAQRTLVDGFFPQDSPDERPQQRRSAIVEFGLPYASDPAITRHLAEFLGQHEHAIREALGAAGGHPIPDTLLFNGGVFRSPVLAERMKTVLDGWRGSPVRLLKNADPDVAVARGAVAYALALLFSHLGRAPKIGGGSPRSYFLQLDEEAGERAAHAVCVLPRGSETGTEFLLEDREFALRLGQPVRFHLLSSTADAGQAPHLGELVELDPARVVRLPPIATVLRVQDGGTTSGRQEIPVRLATALTEVGTLEMHCVSTEDANRRWLLAFQLRGQGGGTEEGAQAQAPARMAEAIARIERIFGARSQKVDPKEVRQLRVQLEKLVGSREQWATPVLRQLFDALWQRARGRRRSADHERVWFNLAGYCLRPGFGAPLDDWRIEQMWPLFESGVQHRNDSQVCAEWWTLWRRVAGGLGREAQLRLLEDFAFNVQDEESDAAQAGSTVRGNPDDMLRLAGSLERIPAAYKAEVGDWLFELMKGSVSLPRRASVADALVLWTIARLGARQPFYGTAEDVVPPDVARRWLDNLMQLDWKRTENAAFATAHLARATGDRARDLPDDLRAQVVRRLTAIGAPALWITMVREVVQLDEASEKGFVGEALPPGLKLIR